MAGNRGQGCLFMAALQVSMMVSTTQARGIAIYQPLAYRHSGTKAVLSAEACKTPFPAGL